MLSVDLNSDMGEGYDQDESLMDWVSSVNIACGYHAGNTETMKRTAAFAISKNKAIGAHPSFPGREHFGRQEMNLATSEIYQIVTRQIDDLAAVVSSMGGRLSHVKPHGALYNMAAREPGIAAAIATAVFDKDPSLLLFGLSGSNLITEAEKIGLATASEAFADRTYQDDGSLTPRNNPQAMIHNLNQSIQQVIMMVREGFVMSLSGNKVFLKAETICLHGDEPGAALFARQINRELVKNNILIGPPHQKHSS